MMTAVKKMKSESMNQPHWKDVLPNPPPGCRLIEAWMTSFEQPDASLLVEHFLPSLLGINNALTQDPKDRNMLFGELGTVLETLRGRLTIITSPPHGTREDSQYPWLWRYVSQFYVGFEKHAVQHAKFWAFHWKSGDVELLELHVSSTNLTISAFKNQLQAGWHANVPLSEKVTKKSAATWGQLIPFIEALGTSSGEEASKQLQRLIKLLGRAECPEGITFIPSIPGSKSAASQIKQFEPTDIHILTPTIGEWNTATLAKWSTQAGVKLEKIRLKWIAEDHQWADPSKWSLPKNAYKVLTDKKVKVQCVANDARFTKEHLEGDQRWSHAKLYLLRKGKHRWLLVTSANWSSSAWGASDPPRNFELGVAFQSDWKELESIAGEYELSTYPHLTEPERNPPETMLHWAEAIWDGKSITLRARSTNIKTPIKTVIISSDGPDKSIALKSHAGQLSWKSPTKTPLIAQFIQGTEILEINIMDVRRPTEFAKTPLPEVDPVIEQALREAFLLQRYGGPVVEPESIPWLGDLHRSLAATAPSTDYTVQAWIDSRNAFRVVDSWRSSLENARVDPSTFERVQMDGKALQDIYVRRSDAAGQLAAEEIQWRQQEVLK